MSKEYTQFDWASDRLARMSWAEAEDRMFRSIDKKLNGKRPSKKRSHKHNNNQKQQSNGNND